MIELDLDNSHSDRPGASHSALTRLAYSPSEGAQVLGISRSKIYELIAARDLKVVKLGSRTLVLHSELVRFVRSLGARRRRSPHTAQPEATG
jgi:excisionase family DNA binding protein